MPKKKTPELDPKEQFKRFQEAAKKADIEVSAAEKAFDKLTKKPSRPTSTSSRS